MKTKNYKFYQHKKCEFFPCHKGIDKKNFSCIFCYCPLFINKIGYCLNNDFGKCETCIFPHKKENYNKIIEILKYYGNIL
jgi:Zn-finger protein